MATQALKFYKYALYSDIPDTVVKGGVYFAADKKTIYVATDTTKANLQKFGDSIKEATFDGTKLTLTKYSGDTITVDLGSLKTAITAAINALDSTVSNTAASAGSTASTQIKTSVTETDGKLSSISVLAPTFATKTELDTRCNNIDDRIDDLPTFAAGSNIIFSEDGNDGTVTISGTPDTHYTSKNVVGDSATANANKAVTDTTNCVYLNHLESNSNTPTSSHKITGSGSVKVTSDSSGNINIYADTNTDTHYTSKNIVGGSTATANAAVSNPYLRHIENNAATSTHQIKGSGATTVSSDSTGNITISSTNTTYGLSYADKKIKLVAGGTTTEIDASPFIKDGMLNNVQLYTTAETGVSNLPDVPYLKFTFNTTEGTTADPIRVSVKSLVDIYTAGDGISIGDDNMIHVDNGDGLNIDTDGKLVLDTNAGDYIQVPSSSDTSNTDTQSLNDEIKQILTNIDAFDAGVTTVGTTGSGTAVSFSGDVKLYNPAVKDIRDYRYLNVVGVNSNDGTTTNPNALAVKLPTGLTVRSLKSTDGSKTLQDEITLDTDTSTSTLGRVVFGMTEDDGENDGNKITATTQGLGTAAGKNIGDFATAAQGTKADSAVQTITGSGITASKSGTAYALGLEWSNFE